VFNQTGAGCDFRFVVQRIAVLEDGQYLEITETSAQCSPCHSQNIIALFVGNVTQVKTEAF
jgi:hypothetical protein